jgi:hypothetical protein
MPLFLDTMRRSDGFGVPDRDGVPLLRRRLTAVAAK